VQQLPVQFEDVVATSLEDKLLSALSEMVKHAISGVTIDVHPRYVGGEMRIL